MGSGPEPGRCWLLAIRLGLTDGSGKAVLQHRSVLGVGGSLPSVQILTPGFAGLCLCSPGQTVLR